MRSNKAKKLDALRKRVPKLSQALHYAEEARVDNATIDEAFQQLRCTPCSHSRSCNGQH